MTGEAGTGREAIATLAPRDHQARIAWLDAQAHALDLRALMSLLAKTKEGRATFVEERHVNGFDSALRTSGELYFKAPDVFERRALKPQVLEAKAMFDGSMSHIDYEVGTA